jgi:hypothetical protein
MSVGNEYLIGSNTSGGEITGPLLLNPIIKNASMVGGICTSGTYSVYVVIIPTQSNWDSNHFKLYLVTYDNFSTSTVGVTPDYPLQQPHILSQFGISLNYYTWTSGSDVTIGIYTDPNNNQFFNLSITGNAVTPHRSSFFFYGF